MSPPRRERPLARPTASISFPREATAEAAPSVPGARAAASGVEGGRCLGRVDRQGFQPLAVGFGIAPQVAHVGGALLDARRYAVQLTRFGDPSFTPRRSRPRERPGARVDYLYSPGRTISGRLRVWIECAALPWSIGDGSAAPGENRAVVCRITVRLGTSSNAPPRSPHGRSSNAHSEQSKTDRGDLSLPEAMVALGKKWRPDAASCAAVCHRCERLCDCAAHALYDRDRAARPGACLPSWRSGQTGTLSRDLLRGTGAAWSRAAR